MEGPDDSGLGLGRLQLSNRYTHKSLYALDALKVGCVLPVSFQLFAVWEAECFDLELSALLLR
jgi:hypothetical protein